MDARRQNVVRLGIRAWLTLEEIHMEQRLAQHAEDVRRRQQEEDERRRRANRRPWVRDWIGRRQILGWYDRLMVELENEDPKAFQDMVRMEPAMFHELEERLSDRLSKKFTRWRAPLSAGLKLAITLKYLGSGGTYKTLMQGFRVPHNTISGVIRDVCQAIIDELRDEVLKCPTTAEEWQRVADGFKRLWNFLHALGALDGKHIRCKKFAKSGSLFYNYKKFFSLVLMALVDAQYKFLWVEVGAPGSCSDAQIWNQCHLKRMMDDGDLDIPQDEPLPGGDRDVPYFIVGDDAFRLTNHLMKPYSRLNMAHDDKVFNYRCSRARRVVENAFGILANRFRCLLQTLEQTEGTVRLIVTACVCLHNLMRIRYPRLQNALVEREDDQHNRINGVWQDAGDILEDMDMPPEGGNFGTRQAKEQRDYLATYYSSPAGAVPWQERMI